MMIERFIGKCRPAEWARRIGLLKRSGTVRVVRGKCGRPGLVVRSAVW